MDVGKHKEKYLNSYAIYKGDVFEFAGTAQECAEHRGVNIMSIYNRSSPSHYKRVASRKNSKQATIIVKLGHIDDDEKDDIL